MLKKIKKLKNKRPSDFICKIKSKIFQKKVYFLSRRNPGFYLSNEFLQQFLDESSLRHNFSNECFAPSATLFPERIALKKRLEKLDSNIKLEIINAGQKARAHEFNLLGSGEVRLNLDLYSSSKESSKVKIKDISQDNYIGIPWHIDFKSGFSWPNELFYTKQRKVSSGKTGVDIKVPWELSRCQHFSCLGLSYLITNDISYALEIKYQITDWVLNNKFCYGVNWVCAMDVGIRAANWLVALDLISNCSEVFSDQSFVKLLCMSILQHQYYLLHNLEWTSRLTSNHYLSNIVGLYFISLYLPVFYNSNKINKMFFQEIENEIIKQTYPDGMNAEGSTSYHRLVLELFSYSAILARSNRSDFSNQYHLRLEKMFEFTEAILKRDGSVPQFGDNDSGYFLKFYNRKVLSHRYLLALRDVDFNQNQKIIDSYSDVEEALFDSKASSTTTRKKSDFYFQDFKFAGVYVYSSTDHHIVIYNGQNGQNGNGGHAHNDKLSFELQYKGVDIFVDPGSYVYSPYPLLRDTFRSTAMHNTVIVEGMEQNDLSKSSLFSMPEQAYPMVSLWRAGEFGFNFKGMHNGFSRLSQDYWHEREFNFDRGENRLVIIDSIGNTGVRGVASFLLAVPLERTGEREVRNSFFSVRASNGQLSIDTVDYSPAYGELSKNKLYRLQIEFCDQLVNTIDFFDE